MAGAVGRRQYAAFLAQAGFTDINIEEKESSRAVISQWIPGSGAENYVVSADISARKPAASSSSNHLITNVPKITSMRN